ncbi:AAA domain-containing protein [Clostridium neonatale]|uniref:AAA domain-containing protein n=1 Tax=Clostridium neonatale TaxID=137838 RepID=UPI00291C3C0C|nr:AAA domain-containing protein [Clostridium neonatale]CAI3615765.1 Superfamily I DNA and/or RNA helicase [Clostridium neonatale]
MNKLEIANKILNFWYLVEFLDQDVYPKDNTENALNVERIKNIKSEEKSLLKINKNFNACKQVRIFHELPLKYEFNKILEIDDSIYNTNELSKKFPAKSSKLHICIGKIKKEILNNKLYKSLELEDKRLEEDNSEICIIGLKINEDGIYAENSLRISPMLWGINKCIENNGDINNVLSTKAYRAELKSYEDQIEKIKPLTMKNLEELYNSVFEKYINVNIDKKLKPELKGDFIYTRYDSVETKARQEEKEDDVSELIKGFYTDDLQMIKNSLNKYVVNGNKMCLDIVDYIVSAYYKSIGKEEEILDGKRIDIRNDKSYIEKWLNVKKSPIGKWPSKFSPALMQQIAINIVTTNSEEDKKIFSVNGPPGTGKTTLLKEIIASNIVERAKFLCKYDKSDDAFIEKYFQYGECKNNGYDDYCNKYYAFKDEKLSEFGMLVVSCNNAAVENITKELPDGKEILSSLKPDKNYTEEDNMELLNISELFDVSKTNNIEKYKVFKNCSEETDKRTACIEDKKDVYFSWLAHKLINNDVKENDEINEWGIISASMGKSSNISRVCSSVLNEFINNFYRTNKNIEERQRGYITSKKNFMKQLKKVEQIQKELTEYSSLSDRYNIKENENRKNIEILDNEICQLKNISDKEKKVIENINLKINEIIDQMKEYSTRREKMLESLSTTDEKLQELESEREKIRNIIIEKEDSRKIYEILFGKWIHTERLNQICELKEKKEENRKLIINLDNKKSLINNECNRLMSILQKYEKDKNELLKNINSSKNSIEIHNNEIINKRKKIEYIEKNIEKDKNELKELKLSYKEKYKESIPIDDKFWKEFKSSDEDKSAKIQITNPWVTNKYNRERERLFYLALQLHKEFILSSKACRDNFKNLLMMWKFRENSKKELCIYDRVDKKNSFAHLINTLFLLIPVMSTTFASVGRFLRDAEEAGCLGQLIIDEAGQAQPHFALGALWRCKRAIVVGDPKQVEPVVTDDADGIKKAFTDSIIKPYTNKSISVQEFADNINRYGSYIKNSVDEQDVETWVGCPLVVHRRCINPMFDISNTISYGGTMKMKTNITKNNVNFLLDKSKWINVKGKEKGNKNHFIDEQGEVALKMIREAFENYSGYPDLYVISPFTTVINGIKMMVYNDDYLKKYGKDIKTWTENNCGTVHKFQGKESNEVIFILGCDEKARGAVKWVKPNVVNVAATRAKSRFYIIGDYDVWKQSKPFEIAKNLIG